MLVAAVLALAAVTLVALMVTAKGQAQLAAVAEQSNQLLRHAMASHHDQLDHLTNNANNQVVMLVEKAFGAAWNAQEQARSGHEVIGAALGNVSERTSSAIGAAVAAAGDAVGKAMAPPPPVYVQDPPAPHGWTEPDQLPPEPGAYDPTDSDPYLSPQRNDGAVVGAGELNPTGVPGFAFDPASSPATGWQQTQAAVGQITGPLPANAGYPAGPVNAAPMAGGGW